MARLVFPDTNVLLHYQPLDQIDWCSQLASEEVLILIPRVVIRELDKAKNTNPSQTIRERARRVLKSLERWFKDQPAILRNGVGIAYLPLAGDTDKYESLDPLWSDDVLVALILTYGEQHPGGDLLLVTQDTGPRLTAQHFGLSVFELPESLRLPPEPDQTARENAELRSRLLRLEAAQPVLSLAFLGTALPAVFHAQCQTAPAFDDEALRSAIRDFEEQYPVLVPEPIVLGRLVLPPDEAEIGRYNRERQEYLVSLPTYLRARNEWQNVHGRTVSVSLVLSNKGSALAEDIDVELHVPDPLVVYDDEGLPEEPEPLRLPRRPRSFAEVFNTSMASLTPHIPSWHYDFPGIAKDSNVSDANIRKTSSHWVGYHVRRLKHESDETLGPLHLVYPGVADPVSFEMTYVLRAANQVEHPRGTLHVVTGVSN